MGRDINKIYNNAVKYYQSGQLTKALEQCERGISIDLKNTSLLNLKGVLLYLNGDLQEAIAVWRINSHYNNDEISKIYIRDAKNDEEKLQLFFKAEKDIKELQVDSALKKLIICAKSDFNSIRVNNGFSICYLRKGEFKKAKEYNEKAFNVDKNNKDTLDIKKELDNLMGKSDNAYKSNIIKLIIGIIILSITYVSGTYINKKIVDNKINEEANIQIEKDDDIQDNISDKIDEVDKVIEKEEQEIVEEKIENLSEEEMQNLYIKATELFDAEEYDIAIENLEKAYNSSKESYLKEHIVFLLASSYENNKNIENGIKYYEEYVEKYKSNNYIEEVYYKLSILYCETDNHKSKEYAIKLKEEYPKSIYVNSIIEEIISN